MSDHERLVDFSGREWNPNEYRDIVLGVEMKRDIELLRKLLEEIVASDTVKGKDQLTTYHLYLLQDGGFIEGVRFHGYPQDGELEWTHDPAPRLTWKGQDYLAELQKQITR